MIIWYKKKINIQTMFIWFFTMIQAYGHVIYRAKIFIHASTLQLTTGIS